MQAEKIVIVGGGVAGLEVATRLGNRHGRAQQLDVTLVDSDTAHVWKPMLHKIAAGTSDTAREQVPYLLHAKQHNFRYALGSFVGLDRGRRVVRVAAVNGEDGTPILDERELPYDLLVLAVGSRANDFGTPGVADHCHIIDTRREADAFNRHVREALMRCAVHAQELRIAIVGGGATGVELAAELVRLLDAGSAYGQIDVRSRVGITLLDSGQRLLGAFPEKVSETAERQLEALGVAIRHEARVEKATADGFVLTDGTLVPASICVWAAGVKGAGPATHALDGLLVSSSNQIVVRATLQTQTDDRVFALGDCASFTPPGFEPALPATAQVAHQQSQHFVRHLSEILEGKRIPNFRFRDFGSLVSLGDYNAVGLIGANGGSSPAFVEGTLAKFGHQLLYRSHQARLHGFWRGSALWMVDRLAKFVAPKVKLN